MGLSETHSNYKTICEKVNQFRNTPSPQNPDLPYEEKYIITEVKQQQKHLSDQELIEIAEKYMSGYSTYELSQEYNCHRYTISNNLKRMGIDVSGHVEGRKYKTEEVIKLYIEEKKSVSEIAKMFNVCDGTIYKCLKRNNVSTNRTRWDYE